MLCVIYCTASLIQGFKHTLHTLGIIHSGHHYSNHNYYLKCRENNEFIVMSQANNEQTQVQDRVSVPAQRHIYMWQG